MIYGGSVQTASQCYIHQVSDPTKTVIKHGTLCLLAAMEPSTLLKQALRVGFLSNCPRLKHQHLIKTYLKVWLVQKNLK